jgi:hypothetical protein
MGSIFSPIKIVGNQKLCNSRSSGRLRRQSGSMLTAMTVEKLAH